MSLEQKANYQLNKHPVIKKRVKFIYQHMMYAVSPKMKSEGNIVRISPDDSAHEYFFGYYDKSPWDASDRYMLCMKAKDTWSDASPKEKADILLIDTYKKENDTERIKKIGETRAWNVQQSCMLQWLGPDYSSRILYNDFREGKYCSIILTLNTMEEKIIPSAVYTVSSDGAFALTLDFSRLYNLCPGYGYYNVPEKTAGTALPDATAVWKIDLKAGEKTELLKYTDFANFLSRPEMEEEGTVHKVNHLMLNPKGDRFIVLYRWFVKERKYTRLITCNVDGTDMYLLSDDDMVSHCFWKNNSSILAFENKKRTGTGYYLMKDKTQKYYHCWKELTGDGHPSFSPDRKRIVTDTYPDRARMAYLKIMSGDVRKSDVNVVAKVFAPFKYDGDTRCDLHPRWNHAGNEICFDSAFEGHRGLYSVALKTEEQYQDISVKTGIKVLYVVDSLKQRFGITAVVMNYFRNLDRERVCVDFLIPGDSEKALVEEIRESGSNVYFMPRLSIKNVKEFLDFCHTFFRQHRDYKIIHSHFTQIDSLVFPIAKKYGVKHCISHSHSTKHSDSKIKAIRNWMLCLPLKILADTWAACGVQAGVFLYGKKFMKSPKHLVVNNAIDISKFKYDEEVRRIKRAEFGVTNEFLIGNIGSMNLIKNQQYLLQIFADLIKRRGNKQKYKLMIVGDGDLRADLQKQAARLRIADNVIFTGVRSDVNEILQAMDVFVLPSLYEGLPVIGVEAQASGLPCLFSSTITREINVCNAKFIGLSNKNDAWIDAIIKARQFKRMDSGEYLVKKGFSIKEAAKKLCRFYEQISF